MTAVVVSGRLASGGGGCSAASRSRIARRGHVAGSGPNAFDPTADLEKNTESDQADQSQYQAILGQVLPAIVLKECTESVKHDPPDSSLDLSIPYDYDNLG